MQNEYIYSKLIQLIVEDLLRQNSLRQIIKYYVEAYIANAFNDKVNNDNTGYKMIEMLGKLLGFKKVEKAIGRIVKKGLYDMDSTIDNDRKVSLSLKRMREKEDQKVKRKHKKREKIGEKSVIYDNIINNIKNLNQDNEVIEIKENEEEKN